MLLCHIMGEETKNRMLRIRCRKATLKRFKDFAFKHDFKNYELALLELLKLAETHPELVRVRWG